MSAIQSPSSILVSGLYMFVPHNISNPILVQFLFSPFQPSLCKCVGLFACVSYLTNGKKIMKTTKARQMKVQTDRFWFTGKRWWMIKKNQCMMTNKSSFCGSFTLSVINVFSSVCRASCTILPSINQDSSADSTYGFVIVVGFRRFTFGCEFSLAFDANLVFFSPCLLTWKSANRLLHPNRDQAPSCLFLMVGTPCPPHLFWRKHTQHREFVLTSGRHKTDRRPRSSRTGIDWDGSYGRFSEA